MKVATAVRNLVEMAEAANDGLRLRDTEIGWPLEELWVTGDLLDGPAELEWATVVLVLDVPTDELPWMARHPAGEWVGDRLRLGKRPLLWDYRPSVYPAWNARHRRVLRFWSASHGLDAAAVNALRDRRVEDLAVVDPADDELAAQLTTELEASRRHLHQILDQYWERDWRRDHKGHDTNPEDHLWRAAEAVREIESALAGLGA